MTIQPSFNFILNQLRQSGLRVTEPRKRLVEILFNDKGHKHITAEVFHYTLVQEGIKISLATVYNTLNVLSGLGLLKKIKTCDYIIFDTNLGNHGHIINENTGEVRDLPLTYLEDVLAKLVKENNYNISPKNMNVIISHKN